ncbi:uncharacterized protein PtrM4_153110 [Pyrenophora tritici-repentis]|uniref:Tc1-like transposase DDE domain-containing protein n=1 Tax=Pyrenophora tritici-repentis TaxID=45151 RepID=A0A834RGW3_9PLEO|nr:hypothetical protein PtrM4_153110 [Pyrenophora tritici-repentis]
MPGTGHRLQPAVLQAILDRIAACESDRAISRATGASRNTSFGACLIRRAAFDLGGHLYSGKLSAKAFRHTSMAHRAHTWMRWDFLYDEYDVRISLASVYRELEKMRWSRKLATKRAKEQSEPLRRLYLARMAQHYKAEQIVALDESACNERTGDRKLLEFQVLPFCNPHPGPASVIVLDNASIHRSERVRVLCQSAGVLLEYLPPYSPDFNPIEKSFKQLKGWMKRNSAQAENFIDFGVFLE